MAVTNTHLSGAAVADIRKRFERTRTDRLLARRNIERGDWKSVEPDKYRGDAYDDRVMKLAGPAEAARGTVDFQPASFLSEGARVRRCVARVLVDTAEESQTGTGFLISPSLFITNQHVIKTEAAARSTRIVFDYELDKSGKFGEATTFELAPDDFFLSSPELDLDFTVLAIGRRLSGSGDLAGFGYCPLNYMPDRHRIGMNVNIIQHPNGLPKTIVIRNNLLVARSDEPGRLYYETDTDYGSSGALVCNDMWDVVALHHYGESVEPVELADGQKTHQINEGIRISTIHAALSKALPTLNDGRRALLSQALNLWSEGAPAERTLERRPRNAESAERPPGPPSPQPETIMERPAGSAKVTLPLEITVSIAIPSSAAAQAVAADARVAESAKTVGGAKTLRSGRAEAARIDRDYTNRNGFSRSFVPGLKIDLGEMTEPVSSRIAPLREEPEKKRAKGELVYENFSVIMDKAKHLALVTATNIDGETYIAINRDTGEPSKYQPRAEGDSWYKDPRITDAYTTGQEFYSEWSHLFDRGHLTRRNDPTWGDNARRANFDTFHFTNCAPQHWTFNQSIDYWQGLERYVLEQGLWDTGLKRKLTVLQGPVFNDETDLWADEAQIPSAFWKIVVWKGSGGLKAVALLADQTKVMAIPRKNTHRDISPDTPVHVDEFRSSVREIAKLTGLNLEVLEPIDTAGGELPKVGEARQVLTRWDQIKL